MDQWIYICFLVSGLIVKWQETNFLCPVINCEITSIDTSHHSAEQALPKGPDIVYGFDDGGREVYWKMGVERSLFGGRGWKEEKWVCIMILKEVGIYYEIWLIKL